MPTTYQRQAKIKLAMTVVTLIVIAGIVMVANQLRGSRSSASGQKLSANGMASQNTTTAPTTTQTPSQSSTSSGSFKDGTYTASSDYLVPHGDENIQVSLTLSNGVITASSVQNSESDPTSASFQESFASMYKSSVVGQKVNGLQLSVIAGASDTTQAFVDAVNQIAQKAQS